MKIVHICLSCFYIDGYAYQENQLVAQHVADGHKVTVLASTESFDDEKQVAYLQPRDYVGSDGARVIRLPYTLGMPHRLARKIRSYPDVLKILNLLKPEVLIFHGLCAWELITVVRYVKNNPNTRLYVDCHEDSHNSARTFLSRWGLHYCFYRPIIKFSLPYIKKVLCVSQETMAFAQTLYSIPPENLEFFPLGGNVFNDATYIANRRNIRSKYGWLDSDRVFVQSGKIDHAKRLLWSLNAFSAIKKSNLRFVIAGTISQEVEVEVRHLIKADKRIFETGWLQPTDLQLLLCGSDVYVQPGSQSATMQMSLCCRCPVILDDVPSHRALFSNNGYLISDEESLYEAMHKVASINQQELTGMSVSSSEVSHNLLDYREQAKRLLK